MTFRHILLILPAVITLSCDTLQTDIDLDKLEDRTNYTDGMLVSSGTYMGIKTERIVLNNHEQKSVESIDLRQPGYYRIELFPGPAGGKSPRVIRVVILDKQRAETEWGLASWTPKGIGTKLIGDEEIRIIHTPNIPNSTSFPIVVLAGGALSESMVNLNAEISSHKFLIKRGVGSAWVKADGRAENSLVIDHKNFPVSTGTMTDSAIVISGTLGEDMSVPAGSHVHIPEDLSIPRGMSLTFQEGSFITLAEAVNIYNEGTLVFAGTEEGPITLTCSDEASFWGGVIGTGSVNRIEALNTIFCRSGYHTGDNYNYGHAKRQALFYSEGGELNFMQCYMIDQAGQVFYPRGATLNISYSLIQRAITGGQANYTDVRIDHSVFTDFPSDELVFQDSDNDAFYLAACDAVISNSVFMYAVDDGLDSGGNEGGEVHVSNTRFESIFHEGAALSSAGTAIKHHYFTNCEFADCGQGIELGFSSPNHQVIIDSCEFTKNGIGIRYGDNYDWSHRGQITVSNSASIENISHDVWNMVRERWEADTTKMVFNNVKVSKPYPLYPQLILYE